MMPRLSTRVVFHILLVVFSLAAGVTGYLIWDIKADVDRATARLTLDPGPASTVIFDSKDQPISVSRTCGLRCPARQPWRGTPARTW